MSYLRPFIKSAVFLTFLCFNMMAAAQSNFYKFTAGGGYGLTLPYPDAQTVADFAAYGTLDYNLTPFITLGAELQKGRLVGGTEIHGFKNSYTTITLNGKVYAGEFMSHADLNNIFLNSIRGLYVGAGVGIIKNDVSFVRIVKVGQSVNGHSVNKDVLFPFNAGINFYFPNRWGYSRLILNLNIQASIFLEDGLDGDLNPSSNFNDIYNFYSLGLKYNFGPLGLDRKR